ncbi:MAG: hydroxyethylthiazole kinase [Brevinema sp.]
MFTIRTLKEKIEQQNPLVLNITNYVTMNFTANALLALGAAPIISMDKDDSADLIKSCDAVQINIGTLDQNTIDLSLYIAKNNNKKKPLILDPVGSGASFIRTNTALSLLPYTSVLRGNVGELTSLDGQHNTVNGVNSKIDIDSENAKQIEQMLRFSQKHRCIIGISGKTDLISDGENSITLDFGDVIMSQITGMGCVLSAITATFCAVEKDLFKATSNAFAFYTLCGELAAKKTKSLGFFESYFLETLANPNYDYIENQINNRIRQ